MTSRLGQLVHFHALLLVTPLVIPATSPRGSSLQLGLAVIVDLTPELGANLVDSRAHFDLLIGCVELEATLVLCLVHGARRHIIVIVWDGRRSRHVV